MAAQIHGRAAEFETIVRATGPCGIGQEAIFDANAKSTHSQARIDQTGFVYAVAGEDKTSPFDLTAAPDTQGDSASASAVGATASVNSDYNAMSFEPCDDMATPHLVASGIASAYSSASVPFTSAFAQVTQRIALGFYLKPGTQATVTVNVPDRAMSCPDANSGAVQVHCQVSAIGIFRSVLSSGVTVVKAAGLTDTRPKGTQVDPGSQMTIGYDELEGSLSGSSERRFVGLTFQVVVSSSTSSSQLAGAGRSSMEWSLNATICPTATPACYPVPPRVTLYDGSAGLLSSNGAARAIDAVPGGKGREVEGVAADGVARLLVRFDGTPNTQYKVELSDETGEILGSPRDTVGLLCPVGVPFSGSSSSTIEITTDGTGTGFAQYLAPSDFVRPPLDIDNPFGRRWVSLRASLKSAPNVFTDRQIVVVRPLVVLIHGLHSSPVAWEETAPVIEEHGFKVSLLDWSQDIDFLVTATDPQLPPHVSLFRSVFPIRRNSLGLAYNSRQLLRDLVGKLDEYTNGENPAHAQIAAAQADVVGHSMGGLMARQMAMMSEFKSAVANFDQGYIHKFVALAVPFRGSPIATAVLDPANTCSREVQAMNGGGFAFNQVQLGGWGWWAGAVANLRAQHKDVVALQNSKFPFPQGMVIAIADANNYSGLPDFPTGIGVCPDTLTMSRQRSLWPKWFGEPNDGFVGESSARDASPLGSTVIGVVHGAGTAGMFTLFPSPSFDFGMKGPHVQELRSGAPEQILFFLNTPASSNLFKISQ